MSRQLSNPYARIFADERVSYWDLRHGYVVDPYSVILDIPDEIGARCFPDDADTARMVSHYAGNVVTKLMIGVSDQSETLRMMEAIDMTDVRPDIARIASGLALEYRDSVRLPQVSLAQRIAPGVYAHG